MTFKNIIDRRRVLLGLAAASTAAAAPAGAESKLAETPDLVNLGDALPDVTARFIDARDKRAANETVAAKVWPRAPEEILLCAQGSLPERDIAGRGLPRPWGKRGIERVRDYVPPSVILTMIEGHKAKISHILGTKSNRGLKGEQMWLGRMEAALPLSEQYCAQIERIRSASGYSAAYVAETRARETLKTHVNSIMNFEPRTMEGVVIQAQAVMAWQSVDAFLRHMDVDAWDWPAKMAASVLAQGGSA